MNDITKGIILQNTDFKENDAIVKVLTSDYGLLSFVCKGTRRINSKNAMSLLPYSLSEFKFDYKDNKDMFSLHSASLLKSYYKEDINTLLALQLMTDIILQAYRNDEYHLLYDELLKAFNAINDNILNVVALFLTKMCKYLGFEMMVDSCVYCSSQKVVSFNTIDGGFLCIEHLKNNDVMDVKRLKKIRLINKIDFDKINILKEYDYDILDLKLIAKFFYNHSEFNDKAYNLFITTINR